MLTNKLEGVEPLLTPGEVAGLFRVDPKTVSRWCQRGLIESIKTPGGHRRFKESDVRTFLKWGTLHVEDGQNEAVQVC